MLMRDPLWRLKRLPWLILLQDALLAVLIATVCEYLLIVLGVVNLYRLMPLLPILMPFVAAVGVGALAVILMERLFRNVLLDTAILWALVPCLALMIWIKQSIEVLPTFLVYLSYAQLVGLLLGISLKGRRYWR